MHNNHQPLIGFVDNVSMSHSDILCSYDALINRPINYSPRQSSGKLIFDGNKPSMFTTHTRRENSNSFYCLLSISIIYAIVNHSTDARVFFGVYHNWASSLARPSPVSARNSLKIKLAFLASESSCLFIIHAASGAYVYTTAPLNW